MAKATRENLPAEIEKQPTTPFVPDKNIVCTRSTYFFFDDYDKAMGLFFFVVTLAQTADERAKRAAELAVKIDIALGDVPKELSELQKIESLKKIEEAGAVKQLIEYVRMNTRHLLTSVADCFLCYLSHLIQSAMRKNHNILKSGETIRIDELLDFSKNKDVVNFIIDKKINDLAYGGMKKN